VCLDHTDWFSLHYILFSFIYFFFLFIPRYWNTGPVTRLCTHAMNIPISCAVLASRDFIGYRMSTCGDPRRSSGEVTRWTCPRCRIAFCLHMTHGARTFSFNPFCLLKQFYPFLADFSLCLPSLCLFLSLKDYPLSLPRIIYCVHWSLLSPYFMSAIRQNLAFRETSSEGVFFWRPHELVRGRRFVTTLFSFVTFVLGRFCKVPSSSFIFANFIDYIHCS
jgi:hypothetical protein